MRHTLASLLLQDGAPITYVSRQLGHKDASITLRVYARWLPDAAASKAVDLLDDTQPSATRTQPTVRSGEWKSPLSAYGTMVSQDGIEPSTRRLRVTGWESADIQPVILLNDLTNSCPPVSAISAEIRRLGFHLGFQKTGPQAPRRAGLVPTRSDSTGRAGRSRLNARSRERVGSRTGPRYRPCSPGR
jgi:hypothetical protein